MQIVDAETVRQATPWPRLIAAVREIFRTGCEAPVRHHHGIAVPDAPEATMLLMPAWRPGAYIGVKLAHVFPGNANLGKETVQAVYVLSDGRSGEPLALIDGRELTVRRTAAASALAADYLARKDAERLLVVGSGRLAPLLAEAHAAVRPIREIAVWGRSAEKAVATAEALTAAGLPSRSTKDLAAAVAWADIVTCATMATEPLVCGGWLRPGAHLDLVGGFRPDMRETDDDAVRRGTVFVDTRGGATKEAGDIVIPLSTGVLSQGDIAADLYDLAAGRHSGRAGAEEITVFKSVGAALEDLAAAITVYEAMR